MVGGFGRIARDSARKRGAGSDSAAGAAVDAIIERPDGTVAGIEVKSGATVGPDNFAGLWSLRDTLDKEFVAGVVLYAGEQVVPSGDRLWLVPLPALWAA